MKSSQTFFNEYVGYITPSDIIEFLYCKRFIYYMKCLGISQNEETRYKVQLGRNLHEKREGTNKEYLRKKIDAVKKLTEVSIVSEKYSIKGKVDEINFLSDNTAAPLDYKFAVYKEHTFKTYKTQLVMYALMIEEVYELPVKKGYLVYCRGGNELVDIDITDSMKEETVKILEEYKKILKGHYPAATRDKMKCLDCCYRNLCV
ncbi:MAG: CRISPR-associated protein Cas4 [Lutisporaceae bacterium]